MKWTSYPFTSIRAPALMLGGWFAAGIAAALLARFDIAPAVPALLVVGGAGVALAVAWGRAALVVGTLVTALLNGLIVAMGASLFGAGDRVATIAVVAAVLAVDACAFVGFALIEEANHQRERGLDLGDSRLVLSEGLWGVRVSVLGALWVAVLAFAGLTWTADRRVEGWVLCGAAALAGVGSLSLFPAVLSLMRFPSRPVHLRPPVESFARLVARFPMVFLGAGLLLAAGAVAAAIARSSLPVGALLLPLLVIPVLIVALRSLTLGLLAVIPVAVAALVAESLVLALSTGEVPSLAATLGLALSASHAVHGFRTWKRNSRLFSGKPPSSLARTVAEMARPCMFSSLAVAVGGVLLLLAGYRALAEILLAAAVAAPIADVTIVPPILHWTPFRRSAPAPGRTRAWCEWAAKNPKTYATLDRRRMSDYSPDEIARMGAYDFFALGGITVLRFGGLLGSRRLYRQMGLKPGMKLLDVGSGTGDGSMQLARSYGVEVHGLDLTAHFARMGKAKVRANGLEKQCQFVLADALHLPHKDNSVDAVLMEGLVIYIDAPTAYREAFRVLKPGGVLAIHDWTWIEPPPKSVDDLCTIIACGCRFGDIKVYTMDQMRELTQQVGFEIPFCEEYPFQYFSMKGMTDNEGFLPLMGVFSRFMGAKAPMMKMMDITRYLFSNEPWFTYLLMVARKPGAAART
ncbi:MAG TPA: methyltransferase domain-containing protein [Thermoplasmata archaeon]|nr:methyltransferase domain-containing protein [Thermoplasmata archaeon]